MLADEINRYIQFHRFLFLPIFEFELFLFHIEMRWFRSIDRLIVISIGNAVKFNVKSVSSINKPINDQFYCDIFNVRK